MPCPPTAEPASATEIAVSREDLPQRKSVRLKTYDYAQAGGYFITVCVQDHACILGEVLNGSVALNPLGYAVEGCWTEIPRHFPSAQLDQFVVMPNHLHGIVIMTLPQPALPGPGGAPPAVPAAPATREAFGRPVKGSLPTIIRSFKSAASLAVRQLGGMPRLRLCQRDYFEHVIRNHRDLEEIRRYIYDNPMRWDAEKGGVDRWR